MRFHVNDFGNAGPCEANPGNCPFASEDEHYATKEEAQKAYERKNASKNLLTLKKKSTKVVKEDGTPLTVYHGSSASFENFENDKTGTGNDAYGSGFYFTTDENTAKSYGENVHSVKLNIQKPIIVNGQEEMSLNNVFFKNSETEEILKKHPDIYAQPSDEEHFNPLGDYSEKFWEKDTLSKAEIDSIIHEVSESSLSDANFTSLESFFGRDNSTDFRKAVYETTGIDGVEVKFEDSSHWIAWFPEQIEEEH
jgi:hypothetical protein